MTSYGSFPVFREPCCLIENCSDGTLRICSDVLDQISKISSPLNVIAMTGPYRTGKSYLLNRLAGKTKGFILGSTIEAMTKGIWVLCRPHPNKLNEVILMLDTEGLGDIQKGNEENDNWIFAISVLLSSTLVYNCQNTISQDGLSKLHYVTELTQRIKTERTSSNENGGRFYRIFPNFVWVVRDFYLSLKKDGQPITQDEYLANSLKVKEGRGKAFDEYNRPRKCIKRFFEDKKCFIFPLPVKEVDKLEELETLPESELNPRFLCEVERFCSYIYTETFPKTASGQPIHGKMFCNLLENYISVIRKGEIICVEDAVKNMAENENTRALKDSVNFYHFEMNIRLPSIIGEKELSDAHQDCSCKATDRFLSRSVLDEQQKYQSKLKEKIGQKFTEFCQKKNMGQKNKETAELTEAYYHLKGLQKKLTEEKQSSISELERKVRQRANENTNNEEEKEILKQQVEEMKQERDQHKKDIIAINEGSSSFAEFLTGTGSLLVEILKAAFVTVGELSEIAENTVRVRGTGAMYGALIGAAIGSVVGWLIGFENGIFKAMSTVSTFYHGK